MLVGEVVGQENHLILSPSIKTTNLDFLQAEMAGGLGSRCLAAVSGLWWPLQL